MTISDETIASLFEDQARHLECLDKIARLVTEGQPDVVGYEVEELPDLVAAKLASRPVFASLPSARRAASVRQVTAFLPGSDEVADARRAVSVRQVAAFPPGSDDVPDVVDKLDRRRAAIDAAAHADLDSWIEARDYPALDGTDGAHPAWWRGCDSGSKQTALRLQHVALYGRDGGTYASESVERAASAIHQRVTDLEYQLALARRQMRMLEELIAADDRQREKP